MQRVEGKQSGNEGAAPQCASHSVEREKEEEGICDVEKEADQVMSARVQAEELDVEHVGEPSQRMPVCRVPSLKGPQHPSPVQTLPDDGIGDDIVGVVQVEE